MSTQTKLKSQAQAQAQAQAQDEAQDDSEAVGVVFTEGFKDAVRNYCEKDDQRMKLQNQLTTIRKELKDLEEQIVSFMDNNNLPVFDTGEKGLFKSATKKKTGGINKKLIIDALGKSGQLKDPKKAQEVAEYIYSSRPTENVKILSRKS